MRRSLLAAGAAAVRAERPAMELMDDEVVPLREADGGG